MNNEYKIYIPTNLVTIDRIDYDNLKYKINKLENYEKLIELINKICNEYYNYKDKLQIIKDTIKVYIDE